MRKNYPRSGKEIDEELARENEVWNLCIHAFLWFYIVYTAIIIGTAHAATNSPVVIMDYYGYTAGKQTIVCEVQPHSIVKYAWVSATGYTFTISCGDGPDNLFKNGFEERT